MTDASFGSRLSAVGKRERKAVHVSADNLVIEEFLPGGDSLPLVIRPAISEVRLADWARNNTKFVDTHLLKHGALLFRGFAMHSIPMFEEFADATSNGGLLDYKYGSTPRKRIKGGIYSSTEYPANQTIPFHNEMSYTTTWPKKIWFCCLKAAQQGGATPIAYSPRVWERISRAVRDKFEKHGVMYVRNYGTGMDLSCMEVFGTTDRAEIDQFCRDAGIETEWDADHRLTTLQKCQATAVHPISGQRVWFNQAHLFHISSLGTTMAEELLHELGEKKLPRNAYYGDGSTIDSEALAVVREAYRQEAVTFPWQEGDVLMLDNMLVAHAREPFEGERRIAVAMAEPYSVRKA